MLAYLFWHRPAVTEPYEADLRAFHASLAGARPPGFAASAAFRIGPTPWFGEPGYEDWYAVADWAALGRLNDAAVAPLHRPAHDRVADEAAVGAGAVYRLLRGEPEVGDATAAAWFAKPPDWTYDRLLAVLEQVPPVHRLWQRQMVLGPAPEFCLWGPEAVELPSALTVVHTEPVRVWP